MAITEFPALVEKAKVVERLEVGNRAVKTAEGPAGSKKGGNQRKPYDRPQPQQGGPVIRQPSGTAGGGRQGGGATLRLNRGVGPPFVRDCPHTESRCFKCHQMGHDSTNCPTRGRPERGDTQRSGDAQRGDRPTTAGRVFALTGVEASTSPDLVKGKGRATGKDVMILFDSGASHSFISYACAAMLGVSVCELGLRLLVSTPASASVVALELCAGCPIVVNEKKYKVNLICLPLVDIDIILGMDWLSSNRILIDCANRRLIFSQNLVLEDLLRACVLDYLGSWEEVLPLVEFTYNNSFHASIGMAPFEALYGRRYRTPMCWYQDGESVVVGPELILQTTEKVKLIHERMKTAQSRQKSYADKRRKHLEFAEGEHELTVAVVDHKLKELRGKSIALVKVLWDATTGEATWEVEQQCRERFSFLFPSKSVFGDENSCCWGGCETPVTLFLPSLFCSLSLSIFTLFPWILLLAVTRCWC
uniref:CCHC-type domain-containing protein n=1 Tax=Cajanus cajan TaxID=3821 RepID=A0A151TZP7_CAJCA|nr:hypothetical protein KK1_005107 [Cajanus cajan]